jgi:Putative metallopeptidase
LRDALERIQEILSAFHSPEELNIKTMECKEVNSRYRRQNYKSTVTICYEFLKRILESLPNENNPDGVTPTDATVAVFLGHLARDRTRNVQYSRVPIFGHEKDAADNFATYIMLRFGEGQAHRLIAGRLAILSFH